MSILAFKKKQKHTDTQKQLTCQVQMKTAHTTSLCLQA